MTWRGLAQARRADERCECVSHAVHAWLLGHPRWVGRASDLSAEIRGGRIYPHVLGYLKMLVEVGALARQGRSGPFVVIDPSKL
jgi:hypothetical protein